jgi:hypothetical protein
MTSALIERAREAMAEGDMQPCDRTLISDLVAALTNEAASAAHAAQVVGEDSRESPKPLLNKEARDV